MCVPSGDHTALSSSAGEVVRRVVVSPSLLTTPRSALPRRPVSKRIHFPSGDHCGSRSAAVRGSPAPFLPSVRRKGWPPFTETLQTAPSLMKAREDPSGDHFGPCLPP